MNIFKTLKSCTLWWSGNLIWDSNLNIILKYSQVYVYKERLTTNWKGICPFYIPS